jgi:predicted kinase
MQLDPAVIQAVADEYYDSLEFPEGAKNPPQFCICVIGLTGAGKTTVLKKIIQHLPAVRVSGDEMRRLLIKKGLPTDELAHIGQIVSVRIKREGYNVAHDADFARPLVRELLREANRGIVHELWVRIAPPESFILDKLKHYPHSWLFADADAAIKNYHQRKELHRSLPELETLPYLYTFDTSRPDLDQQVTEFVALARQKLATIKAKGGYDDRAAQRGDN